MKLTGENRSTREKTCPSATFSISNPTWTDPGSNPGLRGERPATNRLSHGTALMNVCSNCMVKWQWTWNSSAVGKIDEGRWSRWSRTQWQTTEWSPCTAVMSDNARRLTNLLLYNGRMTKIGMSDPHPPAKQCNGKYWRAWPFEGLWSFGCHECWYTDRRTRKAIVTDLWADTMHELGLPVANYHWERHIGKKFWTITQGAIDWMAPNFITKQEEEIQESIVSRRSHGCTLLGWKTSYSYELLAWKTSVEFDCCM
jgi:hypothetical protein